VKKPKQMEKDDDENRHSCEPENDISKHEGHTFPGGRMTELLSERTNGCWRVRTEVLTEMALSHPDFRHQISRRDNVRGLLQVPVRNSAAGLTGCWELRGLASRALDLPSGVI
jgi:hypothetical protein